MPRNQARKGGNIAENIRKAREESAGEISLEDPRTARTPLERERWRAAQARGPLQQMDAERIRAEVTGVRRSAVASDFGTHPSLMGGEPGKGKSYTILHGAVGPFGRGETVHESSFGEGVDFARLVRLGAVAEASAAPSEAEEILDIEPAPRPTLSEALRTDSPPTLPYAPDVAATQAELEAAAEGPSAHVEPLPEDERDAEKASDAAQERYQEERASTF